MRQWPWTHQSAKDWLEWKTVKFLEWSNWSPDLNPKEMIRKDLKRSGHARRPDNITDVPFPPTWNWFHPGLPTWFWTVLRISTKNKMIWNLKHWFPPGTKEVAGFLWPELPIKVLNEQCGCATVCWWLSLDYDYDYDYTWFHTKLVEMLAGFVDSTKVPITSMEPV